MTTESTLTGKGPARTPSPAPVSTNPQTREIFARVRPAPNRGRLVLALDTTASRQPTSDMAAQLAQECSRPSPPSAGSTCNSFLSRPERMQELVARVSDARALVAASSSTIACHAGRLPEIGGVFTHSAEEHRRQAVNAVVFIGDALKKSRPSSTPRPAELRRRVFCLEGQSNAARIFAGVADITAGALMAFDDGAAQHLGDLLRSVAIFATGGLTALGAEKNAELEVVAR